MMFLLPHPHWRAAYCLVPHRKPTWRWSFTQFTHIIAAERCWHGGLRQGRNSKTCMELVGTLAEVYARNTRCNYPIKKLYYSVGTYPQYASTVHVRVVWWARTGPTHNARIAQTLARRALRRVSRKGINNVHVCICVSWAFYGIIIPSWGIQSVLHISLMTS